MSKTCNYPVPKGLSLLPYQREGIAFGLERKNCLIADEMGLGKTIESIGVSNALPSCHRILIVCPASLKLNWQREWERWDVKHLSVGIVNGNEFPDAKVQVVIINYDLLKRHAHALRGRTWDLLIVDECHKLKNDGAQRTTALLGKRHWNSWRERWETEQEPVRANRMLFLTGTPLLNRPAELWTVVHALDPEGLGKWKSMFEKRYCDAHETEYGWDKSGASNLSELNSKLQRFMIRRLKQDVLTELPAKRRQVIVLETTRAIRKLLKAEREAFEKLKLRNGGRISFVEMASERKAVAVAKVPQVIEHLVEMMESAAKVVVFAHHHEVIDLLSWEFGTDTAAIVDGRTPVKTRQAEVDRFQKDPSCKLFICSIQVGGIGFTLTAADTVVFAELDWVPGNLTQAEDRLHRIGQRRSVLIQHVVLNGSLDAEMVETIVRKQKIVDAVLEPIPSVQTKVEEQNAMDLSTHYGNDTKNGDGKGYKRRDFLKATHIPANGCNAKILDFRKAPKQMEYSDFLVDLAIGKVEYTWGLKSKSVTLNMLIDALDKNTDNWIGKTIKLVHGGPKGQYVNVG